MTKNSFGSLHFPQPNLNGFIRNVEKQLKRFHHEEKRSIRKTYLYAIFLGMFGAHHFYLGRFSFGVMYLLTFGLFGIGYVVDLFRIRSLVLDANMRLQGDQVRRTLLESYLLWFPCGILGFHYFYLKDYVMGVLYLLTGGIYGIGWLFDAVRIPGLLDSINGETYLQHDAYSLVHAYLFSLPPFGILGAHHYYCRRKYWGLFYTFTLAGFGIGWIMDFVRMPFLVSRAEEKISETHRSKYHKDDVYLLWASFGLLGAHHFYLRRYRWGLVYLCTLGVLGVGWMADIFRIPRIVNEINSQIELDEDITNVFNMTEKGVYSVPSMFEEYDHGAFDDVIQHSNSPRIRPRFPRELGNDLLREGSNSPRQAGVLGEKPIRRIGFDPDSPMFSIRRTFTTESNSTHTVSLDNSPMEHRKSRRRRHHVDSIEDSIHTIQSEDGKIVQHVVPANKEYHITQSKSAKNGNQGDYDIYRDKSAYEKYDNRESISKESKVFHQTDQSEEGLAMNDHMLNYVAKRKPSKSGNTILVDVHVHNTNNGTLKSNPHLDRKSSISLGNNVSTIEADDNHILSNGIASVDIDRTPTIRMKQANRPKINIERSDSGNDNVTPRENLDVNGQVPIEKISQSARRSIKTRKRSKKQRKANHAVGILTPRTNQEDTEIESPRSGLFPGADPANILQNEFLK